LPNHTDGGPNGYQYRDAPAKEWPVINESRDKQRDEASGKE